MRVSLQCQMAGEGCWNADAISEYADVVNANEVRLAADPNVRIMPGSIACSGCIDSDNGSLCTALLTETQYKVTGERSPRPEDAVVPPEDAIHGFQATRPVFVSWPSHIRGSL